jgi:hypothetical protein
MILGAIVSKLLLNPTTAAKLASKLGAMRRGLTPEVDNVVAEIVQSIGSRMGKTDDAIRTAVEKSRADKATRDVLEKTKKAVIQSATESKNPFIRHVQPSGSANYARAKNTIEHVYDKSGKPRASNMTAGTPERRGVIVTPQGTEIKALPPGQPVWKQMQDGQYQDPKGYYKALEKEFM